MAGGTRFRQLDGLLLLDKPSGMSSNQALQRARHLFRAEKAGHTGSLDPLATGLLPVCFGEATKLAGLLLGSRKAYEAVARLGATTDTDDADGQTLVERPIPAFDDAAIAAALLPFHGRIRQRAPIYSALKQGGERLYAMARRGEIVEAPEREVEVDVVRLVERGGDRLRLHIECGSGTYVRSLVRDLGESLGCGAHVTALRRLWVDPFRQPAMHTLESLQAPSSDEEALDTRLLPLEAGLVEFASCELGIDDARRFAQGQAVELPAGGLRPARIAGTGGSVSSAAAHGDRDLVAVFREGGRVMGLGAADGTRLVPKRLFRWAADPAA